jgi:hypothetical protein
MTEKPASLVAGGLYVSDLSGRLVQAMTVRQHGGPVMMVVTVMAIALHLFKKLRADRLCCQPDISPDQKPESLCYMPQTTISMRPNRA